MSDLNKKLANQSGFTLVEIAIVLLISGFMMMVAANFVKQYTIDTQYIETLEHVRISQAALREYVGLKGVYPCPADPTLAPTDPNYGVSVCRDYTAAGFDPDTCTNVPLNITCTTAFSRNGDGNGGNDVVMIGILPFRTLADPFIGVVDTPFREKDRIDGYGTMLSYAVTEHMTNTTTNSLINPVNPAQGSIRVEDKNQISLTVPDASAHFVVFSHGENRKGGYSPSGNMIDNCMVSSTTPPPGPPAPPPPGPSIFGTSTIQVEIENCDNNDAIFTKSIRSLGNNDNYNDDLLMYTTTGLRALWKRSLASPPGESYIYNTNLGNVGVGTDTPSHRLHIMGDISAQNSVISSNSKYCNQSESACLDPDAIAGSGSQCGANQVAYAVGDNQVKCRNIDWVSPNKICQDILLDHDGDGGAVTPEIPYASFLQGVSNLGNLYCCTSTTSSTPAPFDFCQKQCDIMPCP